MNHFQSAVIFALGWVCVLFDGWLLHSNWLALIGFCFFVYSIWSMCMMTPEDEAFVEIERRQRDAEGWRKRQIVSLRTNIESFDEWDHSHRPEQYWVERRAYLAGFEAGRRFERAKELND
jgi:hypothetical protein